MGFLKFLFSRKKNISPLGYRKYGEQKNETPKEIIREKEKKGEKPRVKKTKVKIIKKTLDIFYV